MVGAKGLVLAVFATFLITAPGQAALSPKEPAVFNSYAQAGLELPKWRSIVRRLKRERAVFIGCRENPASCPSEKVADWVRRLEKMRKLDRKSQVALVNRIANKSPYITDDVNYGQSDYWATPSEFLARSGDCEDYAIFKFFSLRLLGLENEKMRIVVVRDNMRGIAHAVLAVELDDGTYILDNQVKGIKPERRVNRYTPYYSFNETVGWLHSRRA